MSRFDFDLDTDRDDAPAPCRCGACEACIELGLFAETQDARYRDAQRKAAADPARKARLAASLNDLPF